MLPGLELGPPTGLQYFWGARGREVREGFTHVIRAPWDPERTRRGRSLPPDERTEMDVRPHLVVARMDPLEIRRSLLRLLADGTPRTFNAIGIELFDKEADVLYRTKVDAALWDLVDEGKVEHSLEAPIVFRRSRGRLKNRIELGTPVPKKPATKAKRTRAPKRRPKVWRGTDEQRRLNLELARKAKPGDVVTIDAGPWLRKYVVVGPANADYLGPTAYRGVLHTPSLELTPVPGARYSKDARLFFEVSASAGYYVRHPEEYFEGADLDLQFVDAPYKPSSLLPVDLEPR